MRVCCLTRQHQTFPQFTLFYPLCVLNLAFGFLYKFSSRLEVKSHTNILCPASKQSTAAFLSHVCFGIYKCVVGSPLVVSHDFHEYDFQ